MPVRLGVKRDWPTLVSTNDAAQRKYDALFAGAKTAPGYERIAPGRS
ncbi:MAG: hypothetical protein U1E76_14265 [Planctomycetota bacterium]